MIDLQKKNVYIIQTAFSYDKSLVYLPYAAGCLAAAAAADKDCQSIYGNPSILFLRKRIDEMLEDIKEPAVAAFSTYFWNCNYNMALAEKLKERFPSCVVVFGGRQITPNGKMLEEHAFIDYLLHGEGEISFPELLKAIDAKKGFETIDGLSFRTTDGTATNPAAAPKDLSIFPSPYTMGFFDRMIEENPGTEFHATIETNRGCPYGCSYCEWSSERNIREMPFERIEAEIEWVSRHHIPYCYCADGNFGILKRDVRIAETVIKYRSTFGYPKIFKPCYAKGGDDTVFEAGKILNNAGADKGITIAYQSLNPKSLESVRRHNISIESFRSLAERFNKAGVPTYSELIVGLPGETTESFMRGLCELPEMGQHNSVTYHHCQVYPNTEMYSEEYRKKYGIVATKVPIDTIHFTANYNGIEEYFYIITATSSMNFEDWQKANVFAVMTECFHYLGLLKCFAIFLRYEKNVSYYEFYSKLYSFISASSGITGCLFGRVKEKASHPETGWTYINKRFGSTGWYWEEGCFLELCENIDSFRDEIIPFLKMFGIENEIFDSLVKYQFDIIRRADGKNELSIDNNYDFYSYFKNIFNNEYSPLEKKSTRLDIRFHKYIPDFETYAKEIIWYGKRRGETLVTNDTEDIIVSYLPVKQ